MSQPRPERRRRAATVSHRHDLRRRVVYLMLFRLVLISLVLGATLLISGFSDIDLSAPSALVLFSVIGTTYLLTIVYALAIDRVRDLVRLAQVQFAVDLGISALLVHVTGGAQSAYTFLFPLEIIAGATIQFRRGAVVVAAAASALFVAVSVLGWLGALPIPEGQRIVPTEQSAAELGRALALNLAAFAGVAMLAYNLGGQIQATSASLETQRSAVADLAQLHEDIVRCLDSGLITIGADRRVITMNQAACEILGFEQDAAIGAAIEDVVPGIEALLASASDSSRSASLQRAELAIARGDTALALGVSISPLRKGGAVIGRIVNFQDLTVLREMERQVRRAERLAVLGRLAAGVAHEIRNPLASISGSIELLRSDLGDDDDSRALMDIVLREVERLNGLVSELLDYTNPQSRERVEFDLAALVRETLLVFEQDRGFDDVTVTLRDRSGPEVMAMTADPGRIRQVLWNLVRNAAEAAQQGGGHVVVELAVGSSGGAVGAGAGERDAGVAEIAVEDDGPGIAEEDIERIFDPFFTTKPTGSGLGLATCHSVVTEHGGTIRAVRLPDRGSRFVVALPLSS